VRRELAAAEAAVEADLGRRVGAAEHVHDAVAVQIRELRIESDAS
jgi:hypothetical protein